MLEEQGYAVDVAPGVNDWGVNVFAFKDKKKFEIQVRSPGSYPNLYGQLTCGSATTEPGTSWHKKLTPKKKLPTNTL